MTRRDTSKSRMLSPPSEVKGMQCLDRSAFRKKVDVVSLAVEENKVGALNRHLRKHTVCMRNLKNIRVDTDGRRCFLLHPDIFSSVDEAKEILSKTEFSEMLNEAEYRLVELNIGYENWTAEEVLRAVLPDEVPNVTGFSVIGHVAHLNLKEAHFSYKHLIGQVLLDKHKNLRSVVNKTDSIDNTYRNFVMELLAGVDDMNVIAKENGCSFKFDFSKVYWNSRLATEHERIISEVTPDTIVFDAFAGVGPFSVPSAKKGATVYANDLNPNSYEALCSNMKSNKVKGEYQTFNMDGRNFISTIVKEQLLHATESVKQHIVIMNLPATAIRFLDSFVGLLNDARDFQAPKTKGIQIFCYCFSNEADYGEDVASRINGVLCVDSNSVTSSQCRRVRNVAPNKDMICAQFYIKWNTMVELKTSDDVIEKKRPKLAS
ncbi:tRNA (guanine(37)-N1)-methyltransferase-like [Watersipora subatra]|uniref:tRNA (guanine(37)-N1)-methyltransferase-like n=1 Tax=Watersipora subatra TaxID=2589382 RepID=UPI00355BE4B0